MKLKSTLLVSILIASVFSIISPAMASADECSSENPCGTWAVVDNTGNVTNIIVCQPSVCGGGTFAGQKVVEQVAPNPITNNTQGTGGWTSSADNHVTVVENIFTVTPNGPNERNFSHSFTGPERSLDGAVSTTSVYKYDCINSTTQELNACATISATSGLNTETNNFTEPKTKEEIRFEIAVKNLKILLAKIDILVKQLGIWVKP